MNLFSGEEVLETLWSYPLSEVMGGDGVAETETLYYDVPSCYFKVQCSMMLL